jgi:hypothetical protein
VGLEFEPRFGPGPLYQLAKPAVQLYRPGLALSAITPTPSLVPCDRFAPAPPAAPPGCQEPGAGGIADTPSQLFEDQHGVRSLAYRVLDLSPGAIKSADPWLNDVLVPTFGPRMVCTRCGIIGADARLFDTIGVVPALLL